MKTQKRQLTKLFQLKKIRLFISIVLMTNSLMIVAQTEKKVNANASIEYKKSVFETSTIANSITFNVQDINNQDAVSKLEKSATYYTNAFSVKIINSDFSKGVTKCEVTFSGTPNFSILNRWFVANNIKSINVNGTNKSRAEFFNSIK